MAEALAQFQPEPTGIPGLDQVLGGGLPSSNLVFVIGPPGAGKTVLSMQLACAAARRGQSVLYLTAYSESHDKLIAHMRTFGFFVPDMIGQQITLLSILALLQGDPDNAVREVARTVRQSRAKLVVIDGFGGVRELFATDTQRRHFLQTLSTQLAYIGANLVITLETNIVLDEMRSPELTISDTIIALHYSVVGLQHRRLLEVRKVRGQRPQGGLHRYHIASNGIMVYPRLEAQEQGGTAPAPTNDRAAFELPALDTLMSGGLNRYTSTLLAGALGTGKTLLALQFLVAGAAAGEVGLFVTFNETPEQLAVLATSFDMPLVAHIADDTVRIMRRVPAELDVDEVAVVLQAELRTRPVQRLVIDGVGLFQQTLDRDGRAQDYFAMLIEVLRSAQVTSLLTIEINQIVGEQIDFSGTSLAVLGENVLLLQQRVIDQRWYRALSILRMRFSFHDRGIHEFVIGKQGLSVTKFNPLAYTPHAQRIQTRRKTTQATVTDEQPNPIG